MSTNTRQVTLHGEPLALSGPELKVGDVVPDFVLTGTDMKDIGISNFKGKTLIICSVGSLDTDVCSTETKRFNQEAAGLSPDVVILAVSRDLPFAQQRWCAAEGVDRVVCASDYKHRVFGRAFGVEIESIGLLARAVFVVGKDGKLQHVEYVPEIVQEPDYDKVLTVLNQGL